MTFDYGLLSNATKMLMVWTNTPKGENVMTPYPIVSLCSCMTVK